MIPGLSETDSELEEYLSSIKNSQIQIIGPELIFGGFYAFQNEKSGYSTATSHQMIVAELCSCARVLTWFMPFLAANDGKLKTIAVLQVSSPPKSARFEHGTAGAMGRISFNVTELAGSVATSSLNPDRKSVV